MIPDQIEETLQEYYDPGRFPEPPSRFGTSECPQAWRFVDARVNPWTPPERAHLESGCRFCAKTKAMLAQAEREDYFARLCPGLNWLSERLDASSNSRLLRLVQDLRYLDWSPSGALGHFQLSAALGVAQPMHFGTPDVELGQRDEQEGLRAIAEELPAESRDRAIPLALAEVFRLPEKVIRDLKGLDWYRESVEARLILAVCYQQLRSQEDAEEQVRAALILKQQQSGSAE